jgi:hypothetical protein
MHLTPKDFIMLRLIKSFFLSEDISNWHEAMVSVNIDIFEMDFESAISCFIRLENRDKIRRTNGLPITVVSVLVTLGRNRRPKCGVTIVTKTTTKRPIEEKLQRPNSTKRPSMGPRLLRRKALPFLFEEINSLKKQLKPVKPENPKKRKAESLFSTEINLTNSSDEMEEYFLFPPTISRPSTKLMENSHPNTELVVTVNVNHEEHVLGALADTGASSSIILGNYTPKDSTNKRWRIKPLGVL